jgi:stress-induced-phosphoprotein 1
MADEAKAAGNEALKAGKFTDAIGHYTKAIELGKDSESLHVYHSNRSGAYLSNGQTDAALKDAKKCTSLKPDWAKGHSRKGTALFKKNMMTLAKEAYEKAVELDPSNQTYKDSLTRAEKQDRVNRGHESGTKSTASSSPSPASSGPAATTLTELVLQDQSAAFQFVWRFVMIVCVILYFIPLGFTGACYRFFFMAAITNNLLGLFSKLGTPQFNSQWASKLAMEPRSHACFYSFIWVAARHPHMLAVIPVLLNEVLWFADYAKKLLTIASPGLLGTASGLVGSVLPTIINEPEWGTLGEAQKWATANKKLPQLSAQVEVAVGFMLIIELLTPFSNILGLGIYWQYLRVRYMLDDPRAQGSASTGNIRAAFATVNGMIDPFLSKIPGISFVWGKIKGLCASMTTLPAPGESASMLPKGCNIM